MFGLSLSPACSTAMVTSAMSLSSTTTAKATMYVAKASATLSNGPMAATLSIIMLLAVSESTSWVDPETQPSHHERA